MILTPASSEDVMLTLFGPHRAEAAAAAAAYCPAVPLEVLRPNRILADYDPFERISEHVWR